MELWFAPNNAQKLEEVRAIIGRKIHIVSLKEIGCHEELLETSGTIPGNSRQKAEYIFKNYRVNCFADDSGLEVESLRGAPGVDSAIYAGPQRSHDDNIQLLLKKLEGITNRNSRFVTVITLVLDGKFFQFEGEVKGKIIHKKIGA